MSRSTPESTPIGLIAGAGTLPMLTAQGVRASGRSVACVGLADQYDAALPDLCDRFDAAGVVRLGRWIRLLHRWGVREAVMVGRVRKTRMYDPGRLWRQMPDWRAVRLWYRVLRHDRRSQTLLRAVAQELADNGIELIDSTRYISEHIATPGVMTRCHPSNQQRDDIAFARPILDQLNALDIGQAVAVKDAT